MARELPRPVRAALRWIGEHPYLATALGVGAAFLLDEVATGGRARASIARAVTPRDRVNPRGPEYAREHHPLYSDHCAFVRDLRAFVMQRYGLTRSQADLLVALMARETGYGSAAWNYNLGNLRSFDSSTTPWHRLANGVPFRTFFSLEDGVDALVRVLSTTSRYHDAWQMFRAGDAQWYLVLGEAGYYEEDGPGGPTFGQHQRDYIRFLTAVQSC